MPLNWYPDNFKKELLDKLEKNAELVGCVIAQNARHRLEAYEDPDWGKGYRRRMVARLIRSEVERGRDFVVIRVGVMKTEHSKKHGFYIELGDRKFPAHPYLRPAVFENKKKIIEILTKAEG